MEVISQVIIGLSIFELLYWLISEFLLSIREKTKLDQEAQDYLQQQIKSQNDSQESLKNKKE
jgi:uncharacterized membrane protein